MDIVVWSLRLQNKAFCVGIKLKLGNNFPEEHFSNSVQKSIFETFKKSR